MRIVITGGRGQLGRALQAHLQDDTVWPIDLPEHDVSDLGVAMRTIAEIRPDVVIHAAAMTNVDGCARDPEAAYRANALGAKNVALACQAAGAAMLYVSTNEVFDGRKTEPYLEYDTPAPINAYARTKHAGEQAVRDVLTRFYIVRIAWLYGMGGNHFVRKMIQLADQHGKLRVVADEAGSPTYARDTAEGMCRLARTGAYGVYHFVNSGVASRYEFAREILALSGRGHVPIEPISLADFQRPSTPPPYTPLRNLCGEAIGITFRPWQEALAEYIATGDV